MKIKYLKAGKTDKNVGITEGKTYTLNVPIEDPAQTPGVTDRHLLQVEGDEGPVSLYGRFVTDKETSDSIFFYPFTAVRFN